MRSDGAFHLSDFAAWRQCDKRYELEVVGRTPPAWRSPQGINGTAIHRVADVIHAEKLWNASRFTLAPIYHDAFRWAIEHPVRDEERETPIFWGEYMNEETASAAFAGDAMLMLEGYAADERNQNAFILASHSRWRATFAGVPWAGEIDRIDINEDGTATIVDLKSAKSKPNEIEMALWTQLAYAMFMRSGMVKKIADDDSVTWKAVDLDVRSVVWLHLRDYVPYLKNGKTTSGRVYSKGERRGPAYYETMITTDAYAAMAREMDLFVRAVGRGEFPRRPGTHCSYCKVAERCLTQYRGHIAGALNITEEAYDGEG